MESRKRARERPHRCKPGRMGHPKAFFGVDVEVLRASSSDGLRMTVFIFWVEVVRGAVQ
jgi:hypothetical protein